MWRSLVARRFGEPEVAGSNPVFPTQTNGASVRFGLILSSSASVEQSAHNGKVTGSNPVSGTQHHIDRGVVRMVEQVQVPQRNRNIGGCELIRSVSVGDKAKLEAYRDEITNLRPGHRPVTYAPP